MAVNLSFIGGAGWQFLTNDAQPLSGGKLYTYAAGTTTPLTTYTSRTGATPNTNPIILDSAGRTPEQIWSTEGLLYKYVVKDSDDVTIRSWDNIGGSLVASDLAQDLAAPSGSSLVGFLQSGTGAVATTVQTKLREYVTPYDFGAVGDGVADDTVPLQAFFNYLAANKVENADCSGNFKVSSKISYIGTSTNSTIRVNFDAQITSAFIAEDEVILFQGIVDLTLTGRLRVDGQGGTTYSTRTNGVCIVVNNCSRFSADNIQVYYAKYHGIKMLGTTSQPHIKYLRAWYCGGGREADTSIRVPLSFSAVSNTGTSGSTTQTSVLTISPGSATGVIAGETLCKIGTTLHQIRAVDNGTGTITVFPWVENGVTSGTAYLYNGAGYFCQGSDVSAGRIEQLDTLVCGIGAYNRSLYPTSIGSHVTQNCGAGHVIASGASNAAVGGSTTYSYYEANDFDIVQNTTANVGYAFIGTTSLSPSKCVKIAPRLTAGTFSTSFTAFEGVSFYIDGLNYQKRLGAISGGSPSNLTAPLKPTNTPVYSYRANSGTINLVSDADSQRLFAINDLLIVVRGTGANGRPTGAFTLTPEAGYSINGGAPGATLSLGGFVGPAIIEAWLNGTNWEVQIVGEQILSGSATYDPPSLNDGDGTTTTVAVTGAAVGDFVDVSFSQNLQGIIATGWVSATDTVSVRFQNETGGVIDLASGTLRVRVREA